MFLRLLWEKSWATPSAMLLATEQANLRHPLALFSVPSPALQSPQLVPRP
jgi:hypothetical protein